MDGSGVKIKSKQTFLILLGLLISCVLILFIKWWFFTEYTYYKEPTASNLLLAINPKLHYGNSLKARSQLYCMYSFRKADECYAVVIVESNPEAVTKYKAALESLVVDFIKQEELKANKFKQLPFTITKVKFVYKNQFLFNINIKKGN